MRFKKIMDAEYIAYDFAAAHLRNWPNSHHNNLMLHHSCDISKDELLVINQEKYFLAPHQESSS